MGFSRQEHWSGLPCSPPGDLPDPGIKPMSLAPLALAGCVFTTSATWFVFKKHSVLYTGHCHSIVPKRRVCIVILMLESVINSTWQHWKWKMTVAQSCLTLSDPMDSPWNAPGQNTGEGDPSLLQGILPTQGLNPGLPHCRWILYQLSHQGSPLFTTNLSTMECAKLYGPSW